MSIKRESIRIGEDVHPTSAREKSVVQRDIGTIADSSSASCANDVVRLKVARLKMGLGVYERERIQKRTILTIALGPFRILEARS